MDEKLIREKVRCCACGGSLKNNYNINMVCLMKEAQWKYPAWGNILLKVWGFAGAVVCDKCLKENKPIKFAVEWTQDLSNVKYHPVEKLRAVPKEIFEPLDILEPGRHGVAG